MCSRVNDKLIVAEALKKLSSLMVVRGGKGICIVAQGPNDRTHERWVGEGRGGNDKIISSLIKIYEN